MPWNGWTRSLRISSEPRSISLLLILGAFAGLSLVGLAGCSAKAETSLPPQSTGEAGGQENLVQPPDTTALDLLQPHLTDLPLEVRSAILSDPEGFLATLRDAMSTRRLNWVLVDKEHGLTADFVPEELVSLNNFAGPLVVNREDMVLDRRAAEALAEMSEAAAEQGIVLDVSSAYRSYEYQSGLFDRHVAEMGREEAARVSAEPGHSQHQLGTAVDFGSITLAYANTPAGRWLDEEAWRYGFSLSYPQGAEDITGYSYEPWHFRYVGRETALLERHYFGAMQQWTLEFIADHGQALLVARE